MEMRILGSGRFGCDRHAVLTTPSTILFCTKLLKSYRVITPSTLHGRIQ